MILSNGIAIAISWPNFMGKQSGSWYDPLMQLIGINKNFHYRVGHASLILVNGKGNCFYFDCGRFHAPFQKGRIRDISTDFDIFVQTKAIVSYGKVVNIYEILKEIQLNKACKGEGHLKAAFCAINFESAYSAVKFKQNEGIIPFSPFKKNDTNCCRFVQKGILAGLPSAKYKWKLKWLFPIIPMPQTIVNLLPNKICVPEREKLEEYKFVSHFFKGLIRTQLCYNKNNVMGTLPKPIKPQNIPTDCQWLSGEMSGSWFHILQSQNDYIIKRYSPEGTIACGGRFYLKTNYMFDINKPFYITYLSHCSKVTIIQDNETFEFIRV